MTRRPSLAIIRDKLLVPADLMTIAGKMFRVIPMELGQLQRLDRIEADVIIADLDGFLPEQVHQLSEDLRRIRKGGQTVLIISNRAQRPTVIAAQLLKGNNYLSRPLDDSNLGTLLRGLTSLVTLRHSGKNRMVESKLEIATPTMRTGLDAATDSLDSVFSIPAGNRAMTQDEIERRSVDIVSAVATHGLKGWIDTVQHHHDPTYKHCLMVTGTAVAFGRHVGFNMHDINRVTVGALLHDVGKVVVPVEILEKPGKLTPKEFEILKRHTTAGKEMLEQAGAFESEMLELVLSHHEYLDGTGYPHGLKGDQIPDLVRLITIADIFSALVEKRSYKAAMSNQAAYDVLISMRGKLDIPLVKAQRDILLAA
jgi:putative nucleotidyltransferase with HDIG domain